MDKLQKENKRIQNIPIGSSEFSLTSFFWLLCGPEADSAFSRNEYNEYLLEGKGGRCVRLTTLPALCADCLEILGISTSCSPMGFSRSVMG